MQSLSTKYYVWFILHLPEYCIFLLFQILIYIHDTLVLQKVNGIRNCILDVQISTGRALLVYDRTAVNGLKTRGEKKHS